MLSLLIKRTLNFFDRALLEAEIEPHIIRLSDRRFNILGYSGVIENESVSQTINTKILVNFGIFDREQYFQGPKLKLLENSRPTACYFQWNS